METLMGSCWKIFPLKFGEKDTLICRPGDVSLSRKENGFSRNHKRDVLLGFSLSASFHCKTVRSVSSVAPEKLKDAHNSASSSSTETSNVVMENEKGFYGKEQLEILEGDIMQWCRGTVLKFLDIFGF